MRDDNDYRNPALIEKLRIKTWIWKTAMSLSNKKYRDYLLSHEDDYDKWIDDRDAFGWPISAFFTYSGVYDALKDGEFPDSIETTDYYNTTREDEIDYLKYAGLWPEDDTEE